MSGNAVQRWLQSVLGPYRYRQETYADVDRTLLAFPSLLPRTDSYTYDDGRTVLLLTLQGTIPITFRGATYNIPVALWMPHDFPKEAPIAYVTPTSSMLVRPSRTVEVSGLCKGEYLEAWARKSEGRNLLELIETLQSIFSQEPPLYAKPTQQQHQQQQQHPQRTDSTSSFASTSTLRPPPPAPTPSSNHASPYDQGTASSQYQDTRSNTLSPALPVKPAIHSATSIGPSRPPRPASTNTSLDYRNSFSSPSSSSALSPGRQNSVPQSPHGANGYDSLPNGSISRSTSLTSRLEGQPRQTLQGYQHALPGREVHLPSQSGQRDSPGAGHAHAYSQGQYPPNAASPIPYVQTDASRHPNLQQAALAPQALQTPQPIIPPRPADFRPSSSILTQHAHVLSTPINILDADEPSPSASGSSTPAPPRPVNPEMLNLRRALYAQITFHLSALHAHLAADNANLEMLHQDLLKGEPAITDEMARLEAVRDVCGNVRDRMRSIVDQVERNTLELNERPEPDVDELVCGTNIVHNQLLDLVAEDNALEDTIYHLGRAFNADARTAEELERFLKRTRLLSREQFMRRSLINKILLELALARAQR